jgi:hypothetical protein
VISDASDAAVDAFGKGFTLGSVLGFLVGLVWRSGPPFRYMVEVVAVAGFTALAGGSIGAIIVFTFEV